MVSSASVTFVTVNSAGDGADKGSYAIERRVSHATGLSFERWLEGALRPRIRHMNEIARHWRHVKGLTYHILENW